LAVPLLTHEQEILYGKQVALNSLAGERISVAKLGREPTQDEWTKAGYQTEQS